jgi:hypothetical protein
MRAGLPVVAVSSMLAVGLGMPAEASAADDPRIGNPHIGPCHVQVDKIKTHPGDHAPVSASTPADPSSATKGKAPKPPLGQGEDFRRTNNQAVTTGVFVKCR